MALDACITPLPRRCDLCQLFKVERSCCLADPLTEQEATPTVAFSATHPSRHRDSSFVIHLCRHDPSAIGLSRTRNFSRRTRSPLGVTSTARVPRIRRVQP